MSNPPVTHQPFSLHKQQVQRCLPSLAQSPAVSEVLCHTPQEHLWTVCSPLRSIASRHHHPVPFPLQNPVPTIHGHLGRGDSHRGDAPLHWAGAKTLLGHSCRPVSAQDIPLLMGFWLETHFLPHVEVLRLHKQQPVGLIPKAPQCGVDEGRKPSPNS